MAQFLRRRHRISHHQDSADRQVLLQDEPKEETGDREGLASAGAGFDQAGTSAQLRLGHLEDRNILHASTSFRALNRAPKTARAVCWNSSFRGSVLRKHRSK